MQQSPSTAAQAAPITPPIAYGGHDPLFDSKQAAPYIGLASPHTLEVWRSTGKPDQPEFIRVGRKVLYRKSALDNYLERCTVSTAGK